MSTSWDSGGNCGEERADEVVSHPAFCSDTVYEGELKVYRDEHDDEVDKIA